MKIKIKTLLLGIAVGALGAGPALARCPGGCWRMRGDGGWGPQSSYNRIYDPKTVESITGEVMSVSQIAPERGMGPGLHATVKTDKGTIQVHLGPAWYLEHQDLRLQPKDKVEITGSRVTFDGKPALIASQVKKGNEVLELRDDSGFPRWGGWRRSS